MGVDLNIWKEATKNIKSLPIDNATMNDAKRVGRAVSKSSDFPFPTIHFIVYEIKEKLYSYILDFGILVDAEIDDYEDLKHKTIQAVENHVTDCIKNDKIEDLFKNSVWHDSTAWGHFGRLRHKSEVMRIKDIVTKSHREVVVKYEAELNYAA